MREENLELFSIRATARRLRKSRATIRRGIANGDIAATKIGKRTLVPLVELLRILGRQGEKK